MGVESCARLAARRRRSRQTSVALCDAPRGAQLSLRRADSACVWRCTKNPSKLVLSARVRGHVVVAEAPDVDDLAAVPGRFSQTGEAVGVRDARTVQPRPKERSVRPKASSYLSLVRSSPACSHSSGGSPAQPTGMAG